ncbi:MAG: hypothetical protein JWN62_1426 [Acidimicrobiales bacterium]|nr:hypothetical protein [Acidimicrobiales bacterium]
MQNLRNFSKKSWRSFRHVVAAAFCLLTACSGSSSSHVPHGLQLVLDHRPAPATDTIEVFVCAVPLRTDDPIYGTLPLRLDLSAAKIARTLEANVRPYFVQLSHGRYEPHFTAGTTLTMGTGETHDQCVDRALDASSADAAAVLVVANAEHLAVEPGGWGKPGTACPTSFCRAASTRRSAYIGASDFHPDNGIVPLLDLIEHELGHTLDLPHSGDTAAAYDSALDVMSDSAAPREVQPARKNAQDTIAIDRLELGWLAAGDVTVAPQAGGTFDLLPSNGADAGDGSRLLVLPVSDLTFLTVEYLDNTGLDDALPFAGIAVHRIDQSAGVCTNPVDDVCAGIDRHQIALGSGAPHTDLLRGAGTRRTVDGWSITATGTATGETAAWVGVEVHPTGG